MDNESKKMKNIKSEVQRRTYDSRRNLKEGVACLRIVDTTTKDVAAVIKWDRIEV